MRTAPLFDLVVFDCDGTLVDSQHSIVAAMHMAFDGQGEPRPDASAVRRVVGLSLDEAIGRLRPGTPAALLARLVEGYKQAFFQLRAAGGDHDPLYPGAREAIEALGAAGVPLGIATGKSQRGLRTVLDGHGLTGRFLTLQTADRHPGKPHPAMLLEAMADAGADPGRTLLIGDTSFDMQMAANARVRALGVAWGYHEVAELQEAGAAFIARDFADLTNHLLAGPPGAAARG